MSDQKLIRVLHFSSRYEECGVAKYLQHYMKGMVDAPGIENEYFEVSPYSTSGMSTQDIQEMANKLEKELADFDILHVQFEFAIYAHDSFRHIVEAGKRSGVKVVLTVHISPDQHGASKPVKLKGVGPTGIAIFIKAMRNKQRFINMYIEPFKKADLILVHNDPTIASLERFGVDPSRIKKTVHPVQVYPAPPKSKVISTQLQKKEGDVIFCTIGFLHRYKGLLDAVRALKFLPENYKLAILGGMKDDSDDVEIYNKIADMIDALGLKDRVYITGYVHGDDTLNSYIQECDICVFPYDRVYYANVSSGSFNLAFANSKPVIAYPVATSKEITALSNDAVVLCETFAYYELARELKNIDINKQVELSKQYAEKMSWPKMSKVLVKIYRELIYGES